MLQIGMLVYSNELSDEVLDFLSENNCNNVSIAFWEKVLEKSLEKNIKLIEKHKFNVSCLSVFGNSLENEDTISGWDILIKNSKHFNNAYVSGFAGRVNNRSVEQSLEKYKEIFSQKLNLAYKYDCNGILFENCRMGDTWKKGKWNIAINPTAWNLIFNTIDDEKIGLQWEPYHQLISFVEPLNQLETWIHKIKNIHGKDAKIDFEALRKNGLYDIDKPMKATLPGFGDTNWEKVIEIAERCNYNGSIDLELQNSSFEESKNQVKTAINYLSKNKI